MTPDPLRDRVDRAICALAAATTPEAVDKAMNLSRPLIADLSATHRPELVEMMLHTLDAARLRCPDPQPDAMPGEDDAGGFHDVPHNDKEGV